MGSTGDGVKSHSCDERQVLHGRAESLDCTPEMSITVGELIVI